MKFVMSFCTYIMNSRTKNPFCKVLSINANTTIQSTFTTIQIGVVAIAAKVFQNRSRKLGDGDITFTDNANTKTKIEIIIFKGINTIFFNMGFRLSSSLSHDKIFIFSNSSNTNSQIGIRFIIIFYNIVSLNYVCYNNSIISDFSNTSAIAICPLCKVLYIRLYYIIVS